MRVFKRKRKNKNGKTVKYRNYSVEFNDHREKKRCITAYPNKQASDELGRKIGHIVNSKITAQPLTPEISRYIDSLPKRILDNLVNWDIISNARAAGVKKLHDLASLWKKQALIPGGNTQKHAKLYCSRVNKILEGCQFTYPSDIKSGKVTSWLHDCIEKDKLSVQTRNHYTTAMNAFCGWLTEEGFLPNGAYKNIAKQPLNGAVERDRRALSECECAKLLEAARENGRHHGISGSERALLYQLAMETGLRWSECLSLKVSQFNIEEKPYTVRIEAKHAKNRKDAILPLKQTSSLIERLRQYMKGKDSMDIVFKPWKGKGAPMIRRDLEAAGIDYEDENGQVVDFHSLRHTFATTLANTCRAHPKTMQELLRVSSIDLVMKYYTHSGFDQQMQAVSELPDL